MNPQNDWVDTITVAQLKKIWEPGSAVKTWKDVDPAWPDVPLALFGPGEESGTFDYFTEVINGKEDQITESYSASADDNVTITGIAGEKGGMGFFGRALGRNYSRSFGSTNSRLDPLVGISQQRQQCSRNQ